MTLQKSLLHQEYNLFYIVVAIVPHAWWLKQYKIYYLTFLDVQSQKSVSLG